MIITLTPEDLIKRCLWTKYKRFALKDKTNLEIEEFVVKNEPFSLDEDFAYVIGLLKIIVTDNLIHRFNQDITHLLRVKSTVNENKVLINKSVLLKETLEYKDRFPLYYKPDVKYEKSIKELLEYINETYEDILKLQEIKVTKIKANVEKTFTYLLSNQVKKIIDSKNKINYV